MCQGWFHFRATHFLGLYLVKLFFGLVSCEICIEMRPTHRFVGGKLNMCFNAVDRHVESGRGQQPAIIYDSPVTGTKQIITYRELQEQVAPSLLKNLMW